MLEKKSNRFDGFYTEEVRDENNTRIGFDVVSVKDPERRLSLARLKYVLIYNNTQNTVYVNSMYIIFNIPLSFTET